MRQSVLVGQVQFFLALEKPDCFGLQIARVAIGTLGCFLLLDPRIVLAADQRKISRQINNLSTRFGYQLL